MYVTSLIDLTTPTSFTIRMSLLHFLIILLDFVPWWPRPSEPLTNATISYIPHTSHGPVVVWVNDLTVFIQHGIPNVEELDNANDQIPSWWARFIGWRQGYGLV